MRLSPLRLLGGLSMIVFISTTSFTCSGTEELTTGIKTGNQAPEIICDGMKGDCVPLSKLRGQVVLIEFWASTCDLCRRDHFEMERVYKKYKDASFKNGNGFTIYSIAIDNAEEDWRKAITEDRLSWPHQMCDPRKWNAPSILNYEINNLPKYFLVNGEGEIIDRYILVQDLDKVLEEYSIR